MAVRNADGNQFRDWRWLLENRAGVFIQKSYEWRNGNGSWGNTRLRKVCSDEEGEKPLLGEPRIQWPHFACG